jgi:hypothetical protein
MFHFAFADISIVDVRKNIPLSDEDPSFTDFYLSAGENEGLKKNMVVTVFRPVNIRDNSGAQSYGEISIPVGQVKILAVFPKVAVAREFKLLPREENPMLEQVGLMSGDKVETKDSFIDNSKPKRKPQATTVQSVSPAPVTTTVSAAITIAPAAPPVAAPALAAPAVKAPEAKAALPGEVGRTAASQNMDAKSNAIPDGLLENPVNNTPAASPAKVSTPTVR